MIKIAPSMLSADFANLAYEAKRMENAGADWLHLDIMDGLFVPNISFGMPVVDAINKVTEIPLDVHLMIMNPERYAKQFLQAGADILTIHAESTDKSEIVNCLKFIREYKRKAGLSIKPHTSASEILEFLPYCDLILVMTVEPGFGGQAFMPEMLKKVVYLSDEIKKSKLEIEIQVDGGINVQNAPLAISAGAKVLVAGSSVFNAPDAKEAIASLRNQ